MLEFELASAQEICQHIGQRLRAQRLAALLSQAELAARAGVSTGTVRTLEATGLISADSLMRLVMALGLASSLQHLFELPMQSVAEMERADRVLRRHAPRQRAPRALRAPRAPLKRPPRRPPP